MDFAAKVLSECWYFLMESAPYLLLGFTIAGLLRAFVSERFVSEHLGSGKVLPVVKAALLGIPLPLCSCGVLPASMGLRKMGATKGATVSFMVSTPETGVDSMAVTYALIDPLMTVIRPVAALVTAVSAGLLESFTGGRDGENPVLTCSGGGCGCGGDFVEKRKSLVERIKGGMGYAFGELLRDLVPWLLLGVLLAGLISASVPDGWMEKNLGGGIVPMLVMLVAGIPMYICATASTPIAAALMLKGLSPGAALVLLLSGPATNAGALAAIRKFLGLGATLRYLFSISAGALFMGWLTDIVYRETGVPALAGRVLETESESAVPGAVSVAVLAILVVMAYASKFRGIAIVRR